MYPNAYGLEKDYDAAESPPPKPQVRSTRHGKGDFLFTDLAFAITSHNFTGVWIVSLSSMLEPYCDRCSPNLTSLHEALVISRPIHLVLVPSTGHTYFPPSLLTPLSPSPSPLSRSSSGPSQPDTARLAHPSASHIPHPPTTSGSPPHSLANIQRLTSGTIPFSHQPLATCGLTQQKRFASAGADVCVLAKFWYSRSHP